MFRLGDIVALAGRSLAVMVVDVDGRWVTVAWRTSPTKIREREVHASALVLIEAAPLRRC